MNTCSTCSWRVDRFCSNPKIGKIYLSNEKLDPNDDEISVLGEMSSPDTPTSYQYEVGDNFGCIHHSLKSTLLEKECYFCGTKENLELEVVNGYFTCGSNSCIPL